MAAEVGPARPRLDVVFSADGRLLHALVAAVASLVNSSAEQPLRVTVCMPPDQLELASSSLRCVLADLPRWLVTLRLVAFGEESMRGFPPRRRLVNVSDAYLARKRNLSLPSNFARFYLPELLPAEARYVVYSDVDVVFTCSLHGLLRPLLSQFATRPRTIIAAVDRAYNKNTRMDHFVNLKSTVARRMLPGTPARSGSFNAGFFVADLARWREQNATERLLGLMWEEVDAIERQAPVPPWRPTKVTSQSPMLLLFYRNFVRLPHAWNSASVANRSLGVGHQREYCLWHFSGSGSRKPWCDARPCPRTNDTRAAATRLPKCVWERHAHMHCVPAHMRPNPRHSTCRVLDDRANVNVRG